MQTIMNAIFQDREQAGTLLSKKLSSYTDNAVVVGIPNGGVCVAFAVAEALSLPLEVVCCRKIKHPADNKRTIGSVSINETFLQDFLYHIPQDYVCHQVALIRNALQCEHSNYYANGALPSFLYKTVILVDDILDSSDSMLACLRSIRKQKPLKIIVAVPLVTAEAALIVQAEADDLIFLQMETTINSPNDHYENFPKVDQCRVKELLELSHRMLPLYGSPPYGSLFLNDA